MNSEIIHASDGQAKSVVIKLGVVRQIIEGIDCPVDDQLILWAELNRKHFLVVVVCDPGTDDSGALRFNERIEDLLISGHELVSEFLFCMFCFERITVSLLSANIEAVVFDLDGLMLNTEDVFELAGNELMRRRGKKMTAECHHAMLGRRPQEAFTVLRQLMDIDEPIEDLMLESKEIFASFIPGRLDTMPGLLELLSKIESANVPKAVATSSPRNYMLDMMARFDLVERFAFHLTAEDVKQGKPEPDIYLMAAEKLRVNPGNMLVLEDSEAGTRAAAAAGAVIVSIPNKQTKSQDFSKSRYVANSLSDPQILGLF